MGHEYKQEQLPSGKRIDRHYGPDGSLMEETHSYGAVDIAITHRFKAGKKYDEDYFVKRRMVSRRTYEKTRLAYADMPAADVAIEDSCAALLRGVAKERRQRTNEAKKHQPNPEEARRHDEFCSKLLNDGKRCNAVQWIALKNHTVGERDWGSSKKLVERLSGLGCVHIHACKVDVYEDGFENTGHLVIELPADSSTRGKILKAINRLASETGYNGPLDDGQRYAYVKLD